MKILLSVCPRPPAREQAVKKLVAILMDIVNRNDHASWDCLLHFSTRCFKQPGRGECRWPLALD